MTQNPKILIIDDSPFDRELTTATLQANGFEVIALSTGVNCLETIATEKPSLVLLDILMPDMGGKEALKLIRKKYDQIELPVIMVTSITDSAEIIEALKRGANDYITKPVQFDVASRRIQTHLTITQQAKAMAQTQELAAIHAMIITFNHSINNPLAIACGNLGFLKRKYSSDSKIQKVDNALQRIAKIVKKTNLVLGKGTIEYKKYMETSLMLKLEDEDV
ncbi:response regulator [Bdellovibrionota bacterium FG-2]